MITKIIAPPQPRGPGKTGALRGLAPGRNRGRARHGDEINPVRELPTAGVRGRAKAQTGQTALRVHKLPARLGKQEPCMGPHPETAAGVRGWVKTQTRCANCPPQARGRARLGKGTNPVRVLPTAGAQPRGEEADRANRFVGSRHTTSCIAGDEPAGADSPAPGRRVRDLLTAGARACAVGQRNKPGARIAHRRCRSPAWGAHPEPAAGVRGWAKKQTRSANCPAQPRAFSLPGKQKPCAGLHMEPTACVRGWAKPQTRCANCSAQPRRRKSSAKLCGKRLDNSDKLYYNK